MVRYSTTKTTKYLPPKNTRYLREAAARGLLEVSLHRWLRKIPSDSSSGPSEEGCTGAVAKASFHNKYI